MSFLFLYFKKREDNKIIINAWRHFVSFCDFFLKRINTHRTQCARFLCVTNFWDSKYEKNACEKFGLSVQRPLLLSLQTFVLFERKCPAKWTSQEIPPWLQFEANVYIFHWKCIEVCETWIYKFYIFIEVYDVTLVRAWKRCAVQIHEWMFRIK